MQMPRDFKTARFVLCLIMLAMFYAAVCIAKDDLIFASLSLICAVFEILLMTWWRPGWLRRCMCLEGYDQLPAHCADVMRLPIGRWLVQEIASVGSELFLALVHDVVALVILPIYTRPLLYVPQHNHFVARTLLLQQFHALRGPPSYTCA